MRDSPDNVASHHSAEELLPLFRTDQSIDARARLRSLESLNLILPDVLDLSPEQRRMLRLHHRRAECDASLAEIRKSRRQEKADVAERKRRFIDAMLSLEDDEELVLPGSGDQRIDAIAQALRDLTERFDAITQPERDHHLDPDEVAAKEDAAFHAAFSNATSASHHAPGGGDE